MKAKQKEMKSTEKAQRANSRTQKPADKAVSNGPTCSTRSSAQPLPKKARIQDETIDENECCVCFTLY